MVSRSALVLLVGSLLAPALAAAQQGPGQYLEVPRPRASSAETPSAGISERKDVVVASFDLSGERIFRRVTIFLEALNHEAGFIVCVAKGGSRRFLRFKGDHDVAKVTRTIRRKGFKASHVLHVGRAFSPAEKQPHLLVLHNGSGRLTAAGPPSWVDRIRETLARTPPRVRPKKLAEIYEAARFHEGPLAPPKAPVPWGEAKKIDALARAWNVAGLVRIFREASDDARRSPGRKVQGRMMLGAPREYYDPSPPELVRAEAGRALKACLERAIGPGKALRYARSLARLERIPGVIGFDRYEYFSVDVIGSGRFKYPRPPIPVQFFPLQGLLRQCLAGRAFKSVRERLLRIDGMNRRSFSGRKKVVRALRDALEGLAGGE